MVVIAPIVATDIIIILFALGIFFVLSYGIPLWIEYILNPIAALFPSLAQTVNDATNNLAQWALNYANPMLGEAYSWIQTPASNAILLLLGMHDFFYSIANTLIRFHNRIGTIESAVGSWVQPQSLANTVLSLFNEVSGFSGTINDIINYVNQLATDLANDINRLNGLINQVYNNAVAYTQSYVNNAINQVYGLINADVNSLSISIANVSTYAQAVEQEAHSLANDALSASEGYTNQAVNSLEQILVSYINSSIAGVQTSLLDDISRTTASLQASISGVSTDLKAQLAQVAASAAAADASLSADLKQQLSSLATQLAQTTGALSAELKADYANATASINAVQASLSSTITADVASLANEIVQSEGALSAQLQGQINDVAAAAQAARNALQQSLSASIASVAAQATSTARTLAQDEANCINPTCDAFLPLSAAQKALLGAGTTGLFLAVIAAAISDPLGTATLFQPAVQTLSGPILSDVESLVP